MLCDDAVCDEAMVMKNCKQLVRKRRILVTGQKGNRAAEGSLLVEWALRNPSLKSKNTKNVVSWSKSPILVMPISGQHVNEYFRFEDAVHQTVFFRDASAPTPLRLAL